MCEQPFKPAHSVGILKFKSMNVLNITSKYLDLASGLLLLLLFSLKLLVLMCLATFLPDLTQLFTSQNSARENS